MVIIKVIKSNPRLTIIMVINLSPINRLLLKWFVDWHLIINYGFISLMAFSYVQRLWLLVLIVLSI